MVERGAPLGGGMQGSTSAGAGGGGGGAEEGCQIHAEYGGHGYVVTTRACGDDRVQVEVTGCDRDGQVVVEVSGHVPVEDLDVVARLLAGAARLHQPARAVTVPAARTDGRAYTVEEKRREHPNAYRPWTEQEERQLVRLYNEGASVEELSRQLGRNRGGILSRLTKIGLVHGSPLPPAPPATAPGGPLDDPAVPAVPVPARCADGCRSHYLATLDIDPAAAAKLDDKASKWCDQCDNPVCYHCGTAAVDQPLMLCQQCDLNFHAGREPEHP